MNENWTVYTTRSRLDNERYLDNCWLDNQGPTVLLYNVVYSVLTFPIHPRLDSQSAPDGRSIEWYTLRQKSARLTLCIITQKVFHLTCSLRNNVNKMFLTSYAQFEWSFFAINIIFIIKRTVLLNRVLGKKWHFSSMSDKVLHCAYAVFCSGI